MAEDSGIDLTERLAADLAGRAEAIACLRDALREPPAVARAQELVELFETLADDDPEDYDRMLAAALLELATANREAGRIDDALYFARDGYDIYRERAETHRDDVEVQQDYAFGLMAVVELLDDAGRVEDATAVAAECARTFDRLASELAPGRFKPMLLHAMLVHEKLLEKLGELDAAMHLLEQCLKLSLMLTEEEVPQAGNDIQEAGHRYGNLCRRLRRSTRDDELFDRVLARLIAFDIVSLEDLEIVQLDDES